MAVVIAVVVVAVTMAVTVTIAVSSSGNGDGSSGYISGSSSDSSGSDSNNIRSGRIVSSGMVGIAVSIPVAVVQQTVAEHQLRGVTLMKALSATNSVLNWY